MSRYVNINVDKLAALETNSGTIYAIVYYIAANYDINKDCIKLTPREIIHEYRMSYTTALTGIHELINKDVIYKHPDYLDVYIVNRDILDFN